MQSRIKSAPLKAMNKKAFTLLEILVSAIILTLVMAGVAGVFISGKRYILHARSRMAGGELGKYFLDPLQMYVSAGEKSSGAQDGWGQANNWLTNSTPSIGAQELNKVIYTPTYNISPVNDESGDDTGLRRVNVKIDWTEISPNP